MSSIRERLEEIMNERNLRQADVLRLCEPYCKEFGVKMSRSDISQFLSGKVEPGRWKLTILSHALQVNEAWLMGFDNVPKELHQFDFSKEGNNKLDQQFANLTDEQKATALNSLVSNIQPVPKTYRKPRLGTIACGSPILAVEETDVYDDVPEGISCDFTLICKGDSMANARILDGDVVYLVRADTVEQGEIAAVIIGDEATLKRVYYSPGAEKITLCACNPSHPDMVYFGDQLDQIHIIGKAVAFTSKIKM